jgi:glycosyltransferase involved in cell wall biosynthesis
MNIKHIYWFAPYNLTCPSTRYRGKLPLEYLEKHHNLTYDFIFPQRNLKSIFRFLILFCSILLFRKNDSIIVFQKIISNRLYANLLKILVYFQPQNTLYDIDDAEYYRTSTQTLHFFLKHCQTVSVSSEALKTYCLAFNSNIIELTSPVPKHSHQKTTRNEKFTIGWVGDFGSGLEVSKHFSHKANLSQLLFPELLKLDFPFKLTLIGVKKTSDIRAITTYFNTKTNIEIDIPTHLDWVNDAWLYPMISQFDIGISPMLDHPFNQAKSAFKAKQYLSAGIPTVASDVGENARFVIHEFNGILCQTSTDFGVAIEHFYKMTKKEYDVFSKNALAKMDVFSVKNYCEKFLLGVLNSK